MRLLTSSALSTVSSFTLSGSTVVPPAVSEGTLSPISHPLLPSVPSISYSGSQFTLPTVSMVVKNDFSITFSSPLKYLSVTVLYSVTPASFNSVASDTNPLLYDSLLPAAPSVPEVSSPVSLFPPSPGLNVTSAFSDISSVPCEISTALPPFPPSPPIRFLSPQDSLPRCPSLPFPAMTLNVASSFMLNMLPPNFTAKPPAAPFVPYPPCPPSDAFTDTLLPLSTDILFP